MEPKIINYIIKFSKKDVRLYLFLILTLLPFIFNICLNMNDFFTLLFVFIITTIYVIYLEETITKEEIIIIQDIPQSLLKSNRCKAVFTIGYCIFHLISLYLLYFFSDTIAENLGFSHRSYNGFWSSVFIFLFFIILSFIDLYSIGSIIDNYWNVKNKQIPHSEEELAKEREIKIISLIGEDFCCIQGILYISKDNNYCVINGNKYETASIINVDYEKKYYTQKETETIRVQDGNSYQIKTNTGSLIKRAAIGGAIAGVPGALLGASTADKDIVKNPSYSYKSSTKQTDIILFSIIVKIKKNIIVTEKIFCGKDVTRYNKVFEILSTFAENNNK